MITGAIAAIGIATLTANASSAPHPNSLGSVVSLLAGTTTIMKADDDVSVATRGAITPPAIARPAETPVAVVKPASARFTLSAACQQAINALKALHQADVAEDAAHLGDLTLDDTGPDYSGARCISRQTDLERKVEDDGDRWTLMPAA